MINKADRPGAADARRDLAQMLELGTGRDDGWLPPIVDTVATEGTGAKALLDAVDAFRAHLAGPLGATRRRERASTLLRRLAAARFADERRAARRRGVLRGRRRRRRDRRELDPYAAVDALFS